MKKKSYCKKTATLPVLPQFPPPVRAPSWKTPTLGHLLCMARFYQEASPPSHLSLHWLSSLAASSSTASPHGADWRSRLRSLKANAPRPVRCPHAWMAERYWQAPSLLGTVRLLATVPLATRGERCSGEERMNPRSNRLVVKMKAKWRK